MDFFNDDYGFDSSPRPKINKNTPAKYNNYSYIENHKQVKVSKGQMILMIS